MGRLTIFETNDINIKFVDGIDISQALMRESLGSLLRYNLYYQMTIYFIRGVFRDKKEFEVTES